MTHYKEGNHRTENIMKNYRQLGFNLQNFYTLQVLNEIIAKDKNEDYKTPRQYVEFLRTLDGTNDLEVLEALFDDLQKLIVGRQKWFITSKGKELLDSIVKGLAQVRKEWVKRNILSGEDFFTASEKEQVDFRLFHHLTEIKEMAERLWLTTEEKIEVVSDRPIEAPVAEVKPEQVIVDVEEFK